MCGHTCDVSHTTVVLQRCVQLTHRRPGLHGFVGAGASRASTATDATPATVVTRTYTCTLTHSTHLLVLLHVGKALLLQMCGCGCGWMWWVGMSVEWMDGCGWVDGCAFVSIGSGRRAQRLTLEGASPVPSDQQQFPPCSHTWMCVMQSTSLGSHTNRLQSHTLQPSP